MIPFSRFGDRWIWLGSGSVRTLVRFGLICERKLDRVVFVFFFDFLLEIGEFELAGILLGPWSALG